MNMKFGPITNPETGESMTINLKPSIGLGALDILISSALITSGVLYGLVKAYTSGAKAYELAEFKVLEDLKLM